MYERNAFKGIKPVDLKNKRWLDWSRDADGDRGHAFQCSDFIHKHIRFHAAQFSQTIFCLLRLICRNHLSLAKNDALFERMEFLFGKTKHLHLEISGNCLSAISDQDIVGYDKN